MTPEVDAPAALADHPVGRVLEGRYRIDAPLARGGMATVYEGVDLRLDRPVAIKIMHPALAEDREFVARFHGEAKAAARITSPAVVSVTDTGADGGLAFLVMELVRGRTLRELLRERGALSPLEALEMAEPIAAALAAAHQAGLVHRDVKPENVLLADSGQVKVADFGLARAIEASPLTAHAGLLLGTVAYISPEQVSSGRADARSDVYSAGITLFEMLTGRPPFEGDTPLAVAYRHVHESVPPPGEMIAGIPAGLDGLVLAMTARDPQERPADGVALLELIRRVRQQVRMTSAAGHDTKMWRRDEAPTTSVLLDRDTLLADHRTTPPRPPAGFAAGTLAVPLEPVPAADWPRGPQETPPPPPRRHPERPGRHRRWPWVLAVLLLLSAAAGAGGWWYGSGRYVRVPTVTGLAPSAAEAAARSDHLTWSVQPTAVYSDTVPAGLVARQVPPAGSRLVRGRAIAFTLSRGPQLERVPTVASVPLASARALVSAAHLRVGTVHHAYSDTVPAGDVISSSPVPGTVLRHGTPIALTESSGPAPVPVPDLRTDTLAAATAALTSVGLQATSTQAFSTTVPAGEVISQSVPPGNSAAHGSTVALVVSKGPQLVTVPHLSGQRPTAAEGALQNLGLQAKIDKFPGTPGSSVVAQSPGPGTTVRVGSTVTLYVF